MKTINELFEKVETLIQNNLQYNEIPLKLKDGENGEDIITFVKCYPKILDEYCVGHLSLSKQLATNINLKEVGEEEDENLLPPFEFIDHNLFTMETNFDKNFNFKQGVDAYITFFLLLSRGDKNKIQNKDFALIVIEIIDSNKNIVNFDIKETCSKQKQRFRVYFNPPSAGIYSLSIKFKQYHIMNSPFHFVVLPQDIDVAKGVELNQPEANVSDNQTNLVHTNVFDKLVSSSSVSRINNKSIVGTKTNCTTGRGRLFGQVGKMQKDAREILSSSMAQKRPNTSLFTDFNNNDILDIQAENEFNDEEEISSVKEVTNKLNKIACVHKGQFDDSTGEINSDTEMITENAFQKNIISDHLRKYYSTVNESIASRLSNLKVPPLTAKFVRKFNGLNFPIGVIVDKTRNLLIVCDSSDNALKVFKLDNGKLVYVIESDQKNFKLKRPSAVLISPDNSEIYVKDDKVSFFLQKDN
jgi:hypothetical protein